MIRMVTSLNWVLGFVALIIAAVGPVAYDNLIVKRERDAVHIALRAIIEAENAYFQTKRQYYLFDSTQQAAAFQLLRVKLNLSNSDYLYDVYQLPKGDLVVRAMTRPEMFRDKVMLLPPATPPGIYRRIIPVRTSLDQIPTPVVQDVTLSNKRRGFQFF